MELIDDEGRVGGAVNVVDALVVLLILAVVVAGAAFIVFDSPEPEPETDTTYATLDLGTQPSYIVDAINEGDTYAPDDISTIRITDVYLTPVGDNTRVQLRVELEGEAGGELPAYAGAAPRLGRGIEIVTDRYQVDGRIRAIGNRETVARGNTTVLVQDTIAAADTEDVTAGETIRLSGRTVATINEVAVYPTGNENRHRLIAEATLRTVRQSGTLRFGGTPLRRGSTVTLPAEGYTLTGVVQRVSDTDTALIRENATVLLRDTMDATAAEEVRSGTTIRLANHRVATINEVAVYPTSNNNRRRVLVEASVNAYQQNGELQFGGAALRRGNGISLRTSDYQFNGETRRVQTGGNALTPETTSVVVRDTLATADAAEITVGDEIRFGSQAVATVKDVSQFATNNPDRRRVFVEAAVQTYRDAGEQRYAFRPIRRGQQLTLATEAYTMTGQIERVGEDAELGAESTRTVALRMEDVREDMVTAIQPGMTERAGGTTVARVTAVDSRPSLIIATGEDGSVNVVDHPIDREVTVTTELQVRETTAGPRFKGDPLRQGGTVTLDLGTVTVRATVVNVSG